MTDVVSLDRIRELAAAARAAGQTLERACPWPLQSPAGVAFAEAYEAMTREDRLRSLSRRAGELEVKAMDAGLQERARHFMRRMYCMQGALGQLQKGAWDA